MLQRINEMPLSATTFGALRNVKIDPEVTRILRKMEKESLEVFYLTGSFSIETREPDDIDFFCINSSYVRKFLRSLGFKAEFLSYADSSFQEVLMFTPKDNYWSMGINQIHVQLIHPYLMDKKEEAQKQYELLAPFLSRNLSKDSLRSLWEILMDRI